MFSALLLTPTHHLMSRFARCLITLAVGFTAGAATLPAQTKIIRAAAYVDVRSGKTIRPAVFVVDSGRITAINPATLPARAENIDLGPVTILPGYIDVQAHLASVGFPDESSADLALDAAAAAKAVLLAGFTTIRNGGQQETGPAVDVAVMKAVEDGRMQGPRIIPSGHLIGINGGHCDLAVRTGAAPGLIELGVSDGKASGPDEFAKAVRQQVKYGARTITLCASGGIGDPLPTASAHMTPEELQSAIGTAHLFGARVFAKAHTSDAIRAAVMAGADAIVHGSVLDDSTARLLKARGTFLVPTLNQPDAALPRINETTGARGEKSRLVLPNIDSSFQRARALGIPVAYGSDNVGGGTANLREFSALIRHGMSGLAALQAATINAANAINARDRGELREGFVADLIAVEGDPLTTPANLAKVVFVMKGGEVYRRP
jgi:imidazolonepropionase-like amidohydrolase